MTALLSRYGPGLALAVVIAFLAKLLDSGGFGSALLFALLIGMLARPLATQPLAAGGVDFSAQHLLAVAVALLGVRLTIGDILAIGLWPAAVIVLALALTLLFGWFAARALGLSANLSLIGGSGVAFCGASAAVAVAAVLPRKPGLERDTALVIAGVVAFSAIAMVVYPLIAATLKFDDLHAGLFLGGSIHNVPQAVGAGMTISESAGSTATLTKLFRVSLLAPFVLGLAVACGRQKSASWRTLGLPWFVIAFAVLIVVGSLGALPAELRSAIVTVSGWLMLVAVAAIGMKTSLEAMYKVGARVLLLLVLNSLVLALLLLLAILTGIV
jgi:uncharacterized integral membrane protein (TIGR00698 family)